MKKKLNLTISEQVCKDIKKQAVEENKSVSEIVENLITDYLKTVSIHLPPKYRMEFSRNIWIKNINRLFL